MFPRLTWFFCRPVFLSLENSRKKRVFRPPSSFVPIRSVDQPQRLLLSTRASFLSWRSALNSSTLSIFPLPTRLLPCFYACVLVNGWELPWTDPKSGLSARGRGVRTPSKNAWVPADALRQAEASLLAFTFLHLRMRTPPTLLSSSSL